MFLFIPPMITNTSHNQDITILAIETKINKSLKDETAKTCKGNHEHCTLQRNESAHTRSNGIYILAAGRGGMLCSFLKKSSGSTMVFTAANLLKFPLKYFSPQTLAFS